MKSGSNSSLFSVVVITYNQEDIVLETLNSVYNQSHYEIELVISDDASTDRTSERVAEWLDKHSIRFRKTCFLRNAQNLGIVRNFRQGVAHTTSRYLKTIAGDDLLATDSVSNAFSVFEEHKHWSLFSGNTIFFTYDAKENKHKIIRNSLSVTEKKFFSMSAERQFRYLCYANPISATSMFFTREFFDAVDISEYGFNVIEDRPMWLLATKRNIQIPSVPSCKVFKRIHDGSVSSSYTKDSRVAYSIKQEYLSDQKRYFEKLIYPNEYLLNKQEKKRVDEFIARVREIENNDIKERKITAARRAKEFLKRPFLVARTIELLSKKIKVLRRRSFECDYRELTKAISEPTRD